MKESALKIDLHNKIDHANFGQLKELYGLITNYFNSNEVVEEWDFLPEIQKQILTKGLEQADAGLGTPLKEINNALRKKYKLNG